MAAQGFLKELYFPFPFLVILLYLFQISRDIHRRQLTNGDTSHAPPAAALIPAHSTVEKAERKSRETEMSLKEITSSSERFLPSHKGRALIPRHFSPFNTHTQSTEHSNPICVCVCNATTHGTPIQRRAHIQSTRHSVQNNQTTVVTKLRKWGDCCRWPRAQAQMSLTFFLFFVFLRR